ncbi:hypothetical protein GCM10009557_78040 [Virgisporangium ochraceum]|uniref:Uncharacterized protein n=2 Tax=Virgisporangium ochraceum TaxID=65505 RepID=A0A8J4EBV8_9ACTN|nr:hypothetical protein Voc01_047220 [Virgisporangium ochraceum]
MAGIVAAGAIGAALAVGGVAYAAGDPDTGNGEQIVRVVEDGGGTGYTGDGRDCPDKGTGEGTGTGSGGSSGGATGSGTGDNL